MRKALVEKYGYATTKRLYSIWRHMRQRCNNPNDQAYRWYGYKGIAVCQEWEEQFEEFIKWSLANGYRSNLTIDRIQSDKNYEPSNCRWVTRSENTRRARKGARKITLETVVEFEGETLSVEQWAKKIHMKPLVLLMRFRDPNWTTEAALTYPVLGIRESEMLKCNGEVKPIAIWAKERDIRIETLRSRLDRGWSTSEALGFEKRNQKRGKEPELLTFNGRSMTIREWAEEIGVTYKTLCMRLSKWTIEKSLTAPPGKQGKKRA